MAFDWKHVEFAVSILHLFHVHLIENKAGVFLFVQTANVRCWRSRHGELWDRGRANLFSLWTVFWQAVEVRAQCARNS